MSFKLKSFYINSTIVVTILIISALFLDQFLLSYINSTFWRTLLILSLLLPLFWFLSSSLIEHFIKAQQNLEELLRQKLHELNTPIATIEANLTMLQKSIKDEKNQKRIRRIKLASRNLSRLYESVEKQIRKEVESVEKEEFDLKEILEEVLQNFEEAIKEKEISLHNTAFSKRLYCDKEGFETALSNLIDNAIKYNRQKGDIWIDLNQNTLIIKDSGIGIDTKNLFIVFEKSYQENPTTRGFGMGLSIVKSFCDKEGIKITIDTKKGEGSSFMLDLSKIIR